MTDEEFMVVFLIGLIAGYFVGMAAALFLIRKKAK